MRTKTDPRRPPPRRPRDDTTVTLYGWHAVVEALSNPARVPKRLLCTENAARRLVEHFGTPRIAPEIVRPAHIESKLTPDAVHQGFLLEAEPLESPEIGSLMGARLILVFDQITDPHNVGAIMRSAAAFGVDAVVTTERHSPEATGVLAKAASGGLEHVPIVFVRNLAEALEELSGAGVQCVGLDSEGTMPLEDVPMRAPVALVLGAEGKGLRQRTRSVCEHVARLELPGAIKSLNVSNAAAIALHVARRALNRKG